MRYIFLLLAFLLINSSCSLQTSQHPNNKHMNKLCFSSSPYLLQHADNPVHWQEWGEEALNMAKQENKPLIISIGYAACHWCHVMEHESFSDEEVAKFMNDNFVCIKVDREERPDIDQIYMNAAQLINKQGGWPLNAFALPDGEPFFAGTYYNKKQWLNLLGKISEMYKSDKNKLIEYANQLTSGINSDSLPDNFADTTSSFAVVDYKELFNHWESQIDFEHGGFNRAPKFPLPGAWEFVLQYYYLTKSSTALSAVEVTLNEMAKGGIYDQIGGGFARYSVDSYWHAPHFEKMLYDNAQLISLYSHAYQVTKNETYKVVVEQTIGFLIRELTNINGGYYSSLNADSEGVEGKYYVWTFDEFNTALDDELQLLIGDYYRVSKKGNWENGNNILSPKMEKIEFAKKHNLTLEQFNKLLNKANSQLLNSREKRIRPSTDNKILTSWNALMITGLVDAYKAFGNDDYLQMALKNANFIETNMLLNDGSLYRNYMNGKSSITAFHDDYATLAQAFIDLYSVTFNKHWLTLSKKLTDYCVEHFLDDKSKMFFYTSDVSEKLIARKFELSDNVIPSSNSIMAKVLLKLGHYYDNENYIDISNKMLSHVIENINQSGPWYANWAQLYGMAVYGLYEVAIVGDDYKKINQKLQLNYLPTSIFLGGDTENLPLLDDKYVNGKTLIYVCKNKTCKLPTSSVNMAMEQILISDN